MRVRLSLVIFSFFGFIVVGLDHVLKDASESELLVWQDEAKPSLYHGMSVPIGEVGKASQVLVKVDWHYVRNPVGLPGLERWASPSISFLIQSIVVIFIMVFSAFMVISGYVGRSWLRSAGLPLIVTGALGNLVDRFRWPYVVDYIGVDIQGSPPVVVRSFLSKFASIGITDIAEQAWYLQVPRFNLSDLAIAIGVLLVGVGVFWTKDSWSSHGYKPSATERDAERVGTL